MLSLTNEFAKLQFMFTYLKTTLFGLNAVVGWNYTVGNIADCLCL